MYHIRLANGKNVVASARPPTKQHHTDKGPAGKLPKKKHGDYSDFGPARKLPKKKHGDYSDFGPAGKLPKKKHGDYQDNGPVQLEGKF